MSIRMPTIPRRALAAAVLACPLAGLAAEARAAIVIDIYQNGSGVRADLSGSFNTGIAPTGTTAFDGDNAVRGGNNTTNGLFFQNNAQGVYTANIWTGTVTSTPGGVDRYGANAASFTYATAGLFSGFTSLQLRWFKDVTGTFPNFYVDNSYTGGAVSGTMTFASTTMAALGLDNYGSFVFTFGSGTTDTVTVNLLLAPPGPGPGPGVPLPGAAGLAAVGLAGLSRRRRR